MGITPRSRLVSITRPLRDLLQPNGIILLHDTTTAPGRVSNMYGAERAYEKRVKYFVDTLKQDIRLQVFDLPFDQGVTLVRKLVTIEDAATTRPPNASCSTPLSGSNIAMTPAALDRPLGHHLLL